MKKTYQPKAEEIKREKHLIDANDLVLGRLATKISGLLMGKGKVNYAPHVDMGDFVTIVNAKKVKVTGRKENQKIYYSHSGFPGGFKKLSLAWMRENKPESIIRLAVKRMLPVNRLRDERLARLKIYSEGEKK